MKNTFIPQFFTDFSLGKRRGQSSKATPFIGAGRISRGDEPRGFGNTAP
jgi:hypothetical protein